MCKILIRELVEEGKAGERGPSLRTTWAPGYGACGIIITGLGGKGLRIIVLEILEAGE